MTTPLTPIARTLLRRTPTPLLLLVVPLVAAGWLAVVVARRWWLLWPLLAAVAVWWVGPATATVAVAVVGGLLVVVAFGLAYWSTFAPESWQHRVADPVRSWRRGRVYRRAWDDAMGGCGLVRDGIVPTLMSCRTAGGVDRLLVHRAPGQLAVDWREVASRLASALGVRSVRVRESGPRDVLLLVRWREIRVHDPEVMDDAAVEAEVIETAEQPERGAFPRRPR